MPIKPYHLKTMLDILNECTGFVPWKAKKSETIPQGCRHNESLTGDLLANILFLKQ